ncbi:L-rhamnose mutarotase [Pseudolysinimonas yzui]|nr:L-rhamnose mutarotase [Pseudolysinimonas yzui]
MTRRFGMVCRLRPERREEYLRLHSAVWPQVEATITDCGIRNFTIFVRGDVLFGYFEYIGEDYAADQARMAQDVVTQEWWAHTAPCQLPFDADSPEPNWQELDEVWHLD